MKDGDNFIKEIQELSPEDQVNLNKETSKASAFFEKEYNADKTNVGVLGNIIPQLHVHIIARFIGDKAWPELFEGNNLEIKLIHSRRPRLDYQKS